MCLRYSAADTFFWTIGLTLSDRDRHANDVPLLGDHFSGRAFFELLTHEVQRNYRKGEEQEAQLPLRNRASAMHFVVAKLFCITVMTYNCIAVSSDVGSWGN